VHGRPLVVKSPGHLFRLPMLRALFPRSRMVFIVRDPHEVVPSMEHMTAVYRRHMSLQGPHVADRVATARFLATYSSLMDARIAELAEREHALVRYEELVQDPIGVVRGVYERLGLAYTPAYDRLLTAYVDSVRGYTPNRFAVVPALDALVRAECGDILERHGYARPWGAA
jgi:omega-hydroxy-beta-dihydromenaquinone-9 sulfotransferase